VVKLLDFGLARLHGDRSVESDYVMGTPAYISPEQLRGGAATEASDQYGLGATLFHLLTGKPPFEHPEIRQVCQMHLQAPVPPVISPHGLLPPKLADLVTRCLEKSPVKRFPDLRAVLATIDEIERVSKRRDWTRWLSR
jgi:eukaryotic-like serine/threonine-protein kinase